MRQWILAEDAAGFTDRLEALDLFHADVEQPHARPVDLMEHTGHRAAHHRHVDQLFRIRPDRRAKIKHDAGALHGRPKCGNRRALDPRQHSQIELGHRHQRAGVAGRHRDVGLAFLDRVDGEPHGRLPAAVAQRLTRLIVHPNRDVGVDEPASRFELRMGGEQRFDPAPVADQDERAVGMLRQRQRRAGNDHRGSMVTPHGVERDADVLGHGST